MNSSRFLNLDLNLKPLVLAINLLETRSQPSTHELSHKSSSTSNFSFLFLHRAFNPTWRNLSIRVINCLVWKLKVLFENLNEFNTLLITLLRNLWSILWFLYYLMKITPSRLIQMQANRNWKHWLKPLSPWSKAPLSTRKERKTRKTYQKKFKCKEKRYCDMMKNPKWIF